MKRISPALLLFAFLFPLSALAQEEIDYRRFKTDDASCDVGIRYKKTPEGMILGISALATGKGAEFRKWSVSKIKIRIGDERFRPDREENFYVTEESFFRVPGAIIFAVIGALGEYSNNDFNNTMGKVGVALGLGLIALQAKGELTGDRALFKIPSDAAGKIKEGRDYIELNIENEGMHIKDEIKVGLIVPTGKILAKFNFEKMSSPELLERVDKLKDEIILLGQEQGAYKYGQDPEYDNIQRKIENKEAERGIAYKTWLERQQ